MGIVLRVLHSGRPNQGFQRNSKKLRIFDNRTYGIISIRFIFETRNDKK